MTEQPASTTGEELGRAVDRLGLPFNLVHALLERGHSLEQIEAMTAEQMFSEYCNWHGLIGWGPSLFRLVETCKKARAPKTMTEDELIERVRGYVRHEDACRHWWPEPVCDCGLGALLKEIDDASFT